MLRSVCAAAGAAALLFASTTAGQVPGVPGVGGQAQQPAPPTDSPSGPGAAPAEAAPPSGGGSASPPTGVTIELSRPAVRRDDFRSGIVRAGALVRGRVTGGGFSSGVPPPKVHLEADPWPFNDRWRRVTPDKRVDSDDQVVFGADPRFNTRYRLRVVGGPVSRVASLVVVPGSRFYGYRVGRDRVVVRITLFSPGTYTLGERRLRTRLRTNRMYFYARSGPRHLRLLAVSRLRRIRPGHFFTKIDRRVGSAGRRTVRIYTCVKTARLFAGLDRPRRDPSCGRRRFRSNSGGIRRPTNAIEQGPIVEIPDPRAPRFPEAATSALAGSRLAAPLVPLPVPGSGSPPASEPAQPAGSAQRPEPDRPQVTIDARYSTESSPGGASANPLRVSGRVRGLPEASPGSERPDVVLEADPFPYGDSWTVVRGTSVDPDGRFSMNHDERDRNARYRLRVRDLAVTAARELFARSLTRFAPVRPIGRHRIRLSFLVVRPPMLPARRGVSVHFYARTGERAGVRIASARLRRQGERYLVAQVTARVVGRFARARSFVACLPSPPIVGVDRPFLDRACGRRLIRVR